MRTVYVVTNLRRPLHERIRDLALTVLAWLLLALAVLGHVVGLLLGALDALLAARLGTRRLAYICRLLRQALRDTRNPRDTRDVRKDQS